MTTTHGGTPCTRPASVARSSPAWRSPSAWRCSPPGPASAETPPSPDQVFVERLYTNVLGRPATTGETGYWLQQLGAGTPRTTVAVRVAGLARGSGCPRRQGLPVRLRLRAGAQRRREDLLGRAVGGAGGASRRCGPTSPPRPRSTGSGAAATSPTPAGAVGPPLRLLPLTPGPGGAGRTPAGLAVLGRPDRRRPVVGRRAPDGAGVRAGAGRHPTRDRSRRERSAAPSCRWRSRRPSGGPSGRPGRRRATTSCGWPPSPWPWSARPPTPELRPGPDGGRVGGVGRVRPVRRR